MSLLKRHTGRRRHVGRRVAGVAVGVALIVLGLEAPAFAVTPTVTSFTPTAAPTDCVIQITGANFNNPTADVVTIGGVGADFIIISDTEILAEVPGLAVNGAVTVHNDSGTGSLDGFVKDNDGGGCVPTVTSFTPTCGPAGTDVTITGTNLLAGIAAGETVGADVDFAPYAGAGNPADVLSASQTELVVEVPGTAVGTQPLRISTFNNTVGEGRLFTAAQFAAGTCITDFQPQSGNVGDSVTITGVGFENVTAVQFTGASGPVVALFTKTDTETTDVITTAVPVGAMTGPITLLTNDAPDGTSVQTADFTVGGPPPVTRNVTLKLKDKLTMKGKVTSSVEPDCTAAVSVKLQRKKKGGGWKTLKTVTTSDTGAYSGKVKNKRGKYRSVAPATTVGTTDCRRPSHRSGSISRAAFGNTGSKKNRPPHGGRFFLWAFPQSQLTGSSVVTAVVTPFIALIVARGQLWVGVRTPHPLWIS
jgi:IPT/TIG domain